MCPKSLYTERRQFQETCAELCSLKRGSKAWKEDKETRGSAEIPLEADEHEWLVKVITGHWTCQLHGLLLQAKNLAGKRDFLSRFTALHWASRSGDCEMARQLIARAKKASGRLDVNTESYGSYTPLHQAAMHGCEDAATMLLRHYQAKVDLWNHSGRKPPQYLNSGSPATLQQCLRKRESSSAAAASQSKMTNVKAAVLSPSSRFRGVFSVDLAFSHLIKGLKKSVFFLNGSAGAKKTGKATGIFSLLSKEVKPAQEEAKISGIQTCV